MKFGRLIYLLVICLASKITMINGGQTYNYNICEGETRRLSCPLGTVVAIQQASYGRSSSQTCPRNRHSVPREGCLAKYSLSIVRTQCNNRQSCSLKALNRVFGDPCVGTYKYLNVVFYCKEKDEAYTYNICEGETRQLSCPQGTVVAIQQASYGRSSSRTCPRNRHSVPREGCLAENSLSIVRTQCNNRQSCSLKALNRVFGDPCVGTYKYLNVVFYCKEKDEAYTYNICEGETRQLSCPQGTVVAIQQASYGRSSSQTCPRNRHSVPREGCLAENSLSIVRTQCNNRQSCSLKALNRVFGDPCVGTYKYLNVVFYCKEKDEAYTYNICERETRQLSCPQGTVVAIQQASYGRSSSQTCPRNRHSVPRGGCLAENSLSIVRTQCNNRQSCSLKALNRVFGDPCVGTYKYLNVVFYCKETA